MFETAPHPPHVGRARPHPDGAATVRTAKTKPAEVVLVCRKCAKRAGLSAKEARRLAKAAGRGGSGGGRKVKVVETGCLGPCPKRLLAVATGASLAAGRVALLDPRADPTGTLADLGPPISAPMPR